MLLQNAIPAVSSQWDYPDEVYSEEDLPEGEYVFLEVADTGCSMDQATKERVIELFFTTKFTGRELAGFSQKLYLLETLRTVMSETLEAPRLRMCTSNSTNFLDMRTPNVQ